MIIKKTLYSVFFKRLLDFLIALFSIILLSPVFLIVAILVRINLGSPVIFKQKRPGKNSKIFTIYKFRSMTNKKNKEGELLPDDIRLTKFGKLLRASSLDELPQLFNILAGQMSIVGPRPFTVLDFLFMNEHERNKNLVRPGLTGLAQVNGRNSITWEMKFEYDLKYIKKITFFKDLKIIFFTVLRIIKRSGISSDGMETDEVYGDYLLRNNRITKEQYDSIISFYKENY